MMIKISIVLLVIVISVVLTACAGGGGGSNVVVNPSPTVTSRTYNTNQQVVNYSNGTSVTNTATSAPVTWAGDHVTKTITYTFADATTNPVVSTVPGVVGSPSYSGMFETIVIRYGDASTLSTTSGATSAPVTWAGDHVTKTITYTFADATTNPVVSTVPGVAGTPSYTTNTQTIVTTYGDATTSTATNTAISAPVTWAGDHVTKTITYTFADATTNPVVSTVSPSVSTPTLTAAVYPGNWTTTDTVIAPSVSSLASTYGDGYVLTSENGTLSKPFNQTTLSAQSITDSSGYVTSTTTTYNLTWGIPDKDGPGYVAMFPSGNSYTASSPLNVWNQRVSGQSCSNLCGPTIAAPHPEVLEAWSNGWTGKGVNIVMEDYLTQTHGMTTTILAARYAIGSTLYGFNVPTGLGMYNSDGSAASSSGGVNIGVINASYGENISVWVGHAGPFTPLEMTNALNSFNATGLTAAVVNRYTGTTPVGGYSNFTFTDAVITKSAGNDNVTADNEGLVAGLASNSSINSRLLIVGALNYAGSVGTPATISSYSNTAGVINGVQSRFLVASGTTPFGSSDIAFNGENVSGSTFGPDGNTLGNSGTSYAAPRVAGYVAIVRSKFPNLDAIKTSSIMLDTARYDTLTCYPSCPVNIYGAGEASLSRALAPVGRLR